jgi:hypothetical protein
LYLYDDRDHHMTHFIGFLLEEEIVSSLWTSKIIGDTKHFQYETFVFNVDTKFWGREL